MLPASPSLSCLGHTKVLRAHHSLPIGTTACIPAASPPFPGTTEINRIPRAQHFSCVSPLCVLSGGRFASLRTTFVGLFSQDLCGVWKFCFTSQWVCFQARKFISKLSEQLNPFWPASLSFDSGFGCSVNNLACLTTSAVHHNSQKRVKTSGLIKKLPTPDPQPASHASCYCSLSLGKCPV